MSVSNWLIYSFCPAMKDLKKDSNKNTHTIVSQILLVLDKPVDKMHKMHKK